MENPTFLIKLAAFSIKTYIPFLKDACVLALPFRIFQVLTGSYAEEKCACDQLANGYVQMCVCLLVDVED